MLLPLPRRIDVERRPCPEKFLRRRTPASLADVAEIVQGPCLIYNGGELLIAHLRLPLDEVDPLLEACRRIEFVTSVRTEGMWTTRALFGYSPRNYIRSPMCRAATMSGVFPAEHALFSGRAARFCELYKQVKPDLYERHRQRTQATIRPDYQMPGGVFTSGVVNRSNPLTYHRDFGNFPDSWSAMVVLKDGVEGGLLTLPELNIALEFEHGSVLLFDGQGMRHGVTAIKRTKINGNRFSVVYYTLTNLWECLPPAEELAHVRKIRDGQAGRSKAEVAARIASAGKKKKKKGAPT
jgi:hypothetical protein